MTMKEFWLCFVPLFVAVDVIGVLPMFVGMTHGVDRSRINRIIIQSIVSALVVALLFLFVGEAILRLLGITVSDFMMAGGIILFLISVNDIVGTEKRLRKVNPDSLGPVPLGVPLLVGPAVLTTIMLLVREHGFLATTVATVLNILIAGIGFVFSFLIMKLLGASGAKIVSKIASLFLAAIAVMMVRKGLLVAFGG